MTIHPRNQQMTLPNDRPILYIALILSGIAVANFAETMFLWASKKALWALMIQSRTTSPDLVLLHPVVSALCFIPWGIISDRFGPRSACIPGILLWALGTFATAWSGSTVFLLVAASVHIAGFAALLPAALSAVTRLSPGNHGTLAGLICAFHGISTVTVGLLPIDMESGWRMTLLLAPVIALLPALLGWLAFPRSPSDVSPSDVATTPPARPHRSSGKLLALAQVLLFGAFLYAVKFHLRLLTTLREGMYNNDFHGLTEAPSLIGLAAGFILGGVISGTREVTRLAWLIAVAGAAIALSQSSSPGFTTLGVALAAVGTGFGLLGQLLTLLRPTIRNRPGLFSGLFQTTQVIANGVGAGLPLLLTYSLVMAGIEPRIAAHVFSGLSLLLPIVGLVLAVISRNRVRPGIEGP